MNHLTSLTNSIQLNRIFDVDWAGLKRWSPTNDYNISLMGDLIHSRVPHYDIKLKRINGSFDPNDSEYLESIGIMVALPGFWLIVTLVFFLIFFLCRCCDVNSSKSGSSSSSGSKKGGSGLGCCKCCLFLFTIISVTVISVGILGNFRTHTGVTKIHNATFNLASTVDILRNETNNVENTLEVKVDEDLNKISRKLIGPLVRNYTVLNYLQEQLLHMRRNVTKGINRVGEMNSKIERLDLNFIPRTIDQAEFLRFTITFGILASLGFFCILLLTGICRHSRCLLILFSVLGLLSLVICWVLTSLYLGLLVTGSDFCFNPKPFVSKQFNSMVDPSIVSYYLDCDMRMSMAHYAGPSNNPFRKQLRDIRKSLDGFEEGLFRTTEICENYCPDLEVKQTLKDLKTDAKRTQETLTLLTRISECYDVHMDFLWTMSGFCRETIEGLTLMLASAASTGIIFTLMVLCASHTWINIRKKRPVTSGSHETGPNRTHDATEADAFLPPASGTSTTTSTGSGKRAIRDSYLTSQDPTGTGNRGSQRTRFSHTPPQTPHFPGQMPAPTHAPPPIGGQNQHRVAHAGAGDQVSFVAPPPSYDQVGGGQAGHHAGHHVQQQQVQHATHHQQQQVQQHQMTAGHHHNPYGHYQQQQQQAAMMQQHQINPGHGYQQQQAVAYHQQQQQHQAGHHQVHYGGDMEIMRATAATKF